MISAMFHRSLVVSGGAVVMPTAISVGCSDGDDAVVTLSGTASRLGLGLSRASGGYLPMSVEVDADGGTLVVRGTGNFILQCGWGDSSSNNGVFDVKKAIAWENSGDLVLGDNAKLRLYCSDTLPHGNGCGVVRMTSANARLALAEPKAVNCLNALPAPYGQVKGDGTLVFGDGGTDGALQATFAGAASLVKRGNGTLTISGTTKGDAATLAARSARFAANGTIHVSDVPAGISVSDITVPLVLEDCDPVSALGGWTVYANGNAVKATASYDAAAHLLRFSVPGMRIVIR